MSLSQVVLPELLDQVPQVPLAEDDELVEALVSDRFHETLRVRVAVGAVRRNRHALHAAARQQHRPRLGEHRVPIVDQVGGVAQESVHRIEQISRRLPHPIAVPSGANTCDRHSARLQLDHEEHHVADRFFNAHVTFGATLELLSFDPRSDVASIVLHPQALPVIRAGHVGEIVTHANSLISGFAQGFTLGLVGLWADSAAGAEAEKQLDDAFQRRLRSDVTATINVGTGQIDFVVAPLPSGVAPMRPITTPLANGDRFVVNERQELHPGMPRVVGPFDPAAGALVDIFTDGNQVRYRAECRSTIEAAFGRSVPLGQPPALPPASSTTSGVVRGLETQAVAM